MDQIMEWGIKFRRWLPSLPNLRPVERHPNTRKLPMPPNGSSLPLLSFPPRSTRRSRKISPNKAEPKRYATPELSIPIASLHILVLTLLVASWFVDNGYCEARFGSLEGNAA
jgi:hypothetical protein